MQTDAGSRERYTIRSPCGKRYNHVHSTHRISSIILLTSQTHHRSLHRRIIIILLPHRPSLITPREVHDRNSKERVRRLRNASQHIIPRDESSDDAKHAAGDRQTVVRVSVGGVAGVEVRGSQADESHPDHEEQRAEG